MKFYEDEIRGKIQNADYLKQIVSFDGMKYLGRSGYWDVSPTDVDGFIQLDALNAFIFFELKCDGGLPTGQRRALEQLVDAIDKGGGNAVFFICNHHKNYKEVVQAKDAIVREIYSHGTWHWMDGKKDLDAYIKSYIKHLQEVK